MSISATPALPNTKGIKWNECHQYKGSDLLLNMQYWTGNNSHTTGKEN